jgi:hypothetical protein
VWDYREAKNGLGHGVEEIPSIRQQQKGVKIVQITRPEEKKLKLN